MISSGDGSFGRAVQVRSILRVGMLGLALLVGLLVFLQWRPETSSGSAAPEPPGLELATGERNIDSVTQSLDTSQHANDRVVMRIRAARQVDYADGWNVWEGPTVDIYGREQASVADDVQILGDTMRTTGEVGDFSEVRIIGNVRASLPGSGTFETRRIDYDVVTGVASNCNRNDLQYAGLSVRADCLRFQTAGDARSAGGLLAEELRMWKQLSIAAAEGEGSMPEGLQGSAEEMRFEPGDNVVTLDGEPALSFAGARIRAARLWLDMGTGARELREVRANGSGRMVLGDPGAEAPSREGAGRTLFGEELLVRFAERSRIERVSAQGGSEERARLSLPGQGELRARRIELEPRDQEQVVDASGDVLWTARKGATGPHELVAGALRLHVGSEGLRQVAATDGVAATMAGPGGNASRFTGPKLTMRWQDGAIAEASFADGVEMVSDERTVSAAQAKLEGESWLMDGQPAPHLIDPEMDLTADELELQPDGEIEARGNVRGTLAGSRLAAGAALFGGATSVQLRAGRATATAGGETVLRESVQIVWESQSLVAAELRLETSPGRLRGSGGVELVAVARGEGEGERPSFATMSGTDLLVEQESTEIRVAGEAALHQGDRRIGAARMALVVDEDGAWSRVLAQGAVRFQQPGVQATGERLEYDMGSGELLLLGTTSAPATFVYDELEYRSAEALRVRWEGEDVIIEATESGRTITKVVRAGATEGSS